MSDEDFDVVWTGAHDNADRDLFRAVDWDQVTVPVSDLPNYYVEDPVKKATRERARRRHRQRDRLTAEAYQAWRRERRKCFQRT